MADRSETYKNSFEAFLRNTNEKSVLRNEVSNIIQERKVKSLLDIGAGNGDLAIPTSALVENYTAIEKNPLFVKTLQAAGLRVHESLWPATLPLEGNAVQTHHHDMVLLSHVISYEQSEWRNLLREAWWHVRPGGGVMTLVTYRGEDTDWTHVMGELGQGSYYTAGTHKEKFAEIISYLKGLGKVSDRKVMSNVTVLEDLDEMLQALEFVYTNGRPDRLADWQAIRADFGGILRDRYDINAPHSARKILKPRFQFPFPHFFINVEKNTDVYISYKYRGENLEALHEMIGAVEGALHGQNLTTFCNLHADPYYQRNSFNIEQIFEHCFAEFKHSKQHLIVVHSDLKSEGIVLEMAQAIAQGKKIILAKKDGVQATYLPKVVPEDDVIRWTNSQELQDKLATHPAFKNNL